MDGPGRRGARQRPGGRGGGGRPRAGAAGLADADELRRAGQRGRRPDTLRWSTPTPVWARERAGSLGLSDAARASAEEVERLLRRLEQPAPRLFYADWIVVTPRHRRSGLARLLWTSGLSEALEGGPLDGGVARTVGAHADLLERFDCRDVVGRAYFDWMDGDVRRVAFGGTDRGPIDAALDRARRGRDPVRLTRHDDGPAC